MPAGGTLRLGVEPLEPRRLLASVELPVAADGFATDIDLDGHFESVDAGSEQLQARRFPVWEGQGQERSLLEFDLSSVSPYARLSGAWLRIRPTAVWTEGTAVDCLCYAADGSITYEDAIATAAKVSQFRPTELGAATLRLDHASVQPLVKGGFVGIRLEAVEGKGVTLLSAQAAHAPPAHRPTLILEIEDPPAPLQGTAGDDLFSYRFQDGQHVLTVNGKANSFDAAIPWELALDGLGGRDRLAVFGGAENETARFNAAGAELLGQSYRLTAVDIEEVRISAGGGGAQRAEFADSPGDDRFYVQPGSATMQLPHGGVRTASGFTTVVALATNGDDTARLYDSPGDDRYLGGAGSGRMWREGQYEHRVAGFDRVYASGHAGGSDEALLADSAGSDRFYAAPTVAYFRYGDGGLQHAAGFDVVGASASAGTDAAWLYDSPAADVYQASPVSASMRPAEGASFALQASGFDTVYGWSTGGTDRALLGDSALADCLLAWPDRVQLSLGGAGQLVAYGFGSVSVQSATASDGDTAWFYDSAGDDRYRATAIESRMESLGPAPYSNHAAGFEFCYALASSGNDEAELWDSAGHDRLYVYGDSRQAYYRYADSASAAINYTRGFETINATSTAGDDDAVLFDSAASDRLSVEQNAIEMHSLAAGYRMAVTGVAQVWAMSTSGGEDWIDALAQDLAYRLNLAGPWRRPA